jgi:ATP-dependent DNA helicase RecG
MCYEPVHIEIEPECIRIISYPGIDRSIPASVIEKGERFKTRMYRNRRLGEFLKELDLTEGRCTGIPTIQEELEKNGSPRAIFETDDDRRAVCVTIPIQPEYLNEMGSTQTTQTTQTVLSESENQILDLIKSDSAISQAKIAQALNMNLNTVKYYTKALVKKGVLERNGNNRSGEWVIVKMENEKVNAEKT